MSALNRFIHDVYQAKILRPAASAHPVLITPQYRRECIGVCPGGVYSHIAGTTSSVPALPMARQLYVLEDNLRGPSVRLVLPRTAR